MKLSKVDNEEEYLMISGIQHYEFCKRQWALIHVEQQWEENVRTVEGQHIHKRADQPFLREKRKNKLVVRGMPIQSKSLKVTGICDVVEFIQEDKGVEIFGEKGKYIPVPVEYKRVKPKSQESNLLQLTAQAICLEEMLVCEVKIGFLFYNEVKQRIEVPITEKLQDKFKKVVSEMHEYYSKRYTPKVKIGNHCRSCSLQNICLPTLMNKRSVKSYIEGMINE